jgi:hypothetical protein
MTERKAKATTLARFVVPTLATRKRREGGAPSFVLGGERFVLRTNWNEQQILHFVQDDESWVEMRAGNE